MPLLLHLQSRRTCSWCRSRTTRGRQRREHMTCTQKSINEKVSAALCPLLNVALPRRGTSAVGPAHQLRDRAPLYPMSQALVALLFPPFPIARCAPPLLPPRESETTCFWSYINARRAQSARRRQGQGAQPQVQPESRSQCFSASPPASSLLGPDPSTKEARQGTGVFLCGVESLGALWRSL